MQIKERYHAYPVLAPYTNDYNLSSFDIVSINEKTEGSHYVFSVQLQLINQGIKDLIKEDIAEFVVHVECSKTSFRQIFKSSLNAFEIKILSSDVDGSVEFAPFVIAKKDTSGYSNSSFHEDFNSYSFNIKKGQYICISNRAIIDIIKNKDDLKQLSSIIRIAQVADLDKGTKINLEGERIQILLSNDTYSRYMYASRNNSRLRMLHSMIVLPALIHTLHELKEDSENNFEQYSDRRWFQALKIRLEDIGMNLDAGLLNEKSPYELGQILLDNPIEDALDDIFKSDQEDV